MKFQVHATLIPRAIGRKPMQVCERAALVNAVRGLTIYRESTFELLDTTKCDLFLIISENMKQV